MFFMRQIVAIFPLAKNNGSQFRRILSLSALVGNKHRGHRVAVRVRDEDRIVIVRDGQCMK